MFLKLLFLSKYDMLQMVDNKEISIHIYQITIIIESSYKCTF